MANNGDGLVNHDNVDRILQEKYMIHPWPSYYTDWLVLFGLISLLILIWVLFSIIGQAIRHFTKKKGKKQQKLYEHAFQERTNGQFNGWKKEFDEVLAMAMETTRSSNSLQLKLEEDDADAS